MAEFDWDLVLMEDDDAYAEKIIQLLSNISFNVHRAHNSDEVNQFSNCQDYLLDLQIGDRVMEGLVTAERIRRRIPDARIGILSGRWSESYEQRAQNVRVNFVINKHTPHKDVDSYLERLLESFVVMAKEQGRPNALREIVQIAAKLFKPVHKPEDINVEAFNHQVGDAQWFESNQGKYAAFSEGVLVGLSDTEAHIIDDLKTRPPSSDVLIQKVEKKSARKQITNDTVTLRKK